MKTRRAAIILVSAVALCLVVGVLAGGLSAWMVIQFGAPSAAAPDDLLAPWTLEKVQAHAATAATSEQMAAATGPIDETVEGLFTLDFVSGDLRCFILYPRGPAAGNLGGIYQANVIAGLGLDKAKSPKYMLLTGNVAFIQGGQQNRPALCVCYVVDCNTGAWGAYSLNYNQTLAGRGQPQQGLMNLIAKGLAKAAAPGGGP